jgi:hypothetical protein
MGKSEVYSWRVSPDVKQALEQAARERKVSVARILDEIVREGLARLRRNRDRDEREAEERFRLAASPSIGSIAGCDPKRASRARDRIRARLHRRRGR